MSTSRGSWWWPAILMVAIFLASGREDVAGPGWAHSDKVVHTLVYGLLGTLVARTQPRARYWFGVCVAAGYGLLDEFHQSFTPGRSVEVLDWACDLAGAMLAVGLYAGWSGYRNFLEQPLWASRLPSASRLPTNST